jgi:hypothetical protein
VLSRDAAGLKFLQIDLPVGTEIVLNLEQRSKKKFN